MIRCFPPDRLDLCAKWFELVETNDQWKELGPIGEGESQSIRVECVSDPGVIGAAKPGPAVGQNETCRAAHEKLAFDLAHFLELPVPPVVLWSDGTPNQYKRGRAISLWAFRQSMKWDEANNSGLITDQMRVSAGPAVSAMRVFHTWISDTDRKSDHTQINVDSSNGQLGVAFIDHAFSMSHVWQAPCAPTGACPNYMPAPEMADVMRETAQRIAAFPDDEILRLVNRIPVTYLPEPHRGVIMPNLLSRKADLLRLLRVP